MWSTLWFKIAQLLFGLRLKKSNAHTTLRLVQTHPGVWFSEPNKKSDTSLRVNLQKGQMISRAYLWISRTIEWWSILKYTFQVQHTMILRRMKSLKKWYFYHACRFYILKSKTDRFIELFPSKFWMYVTNVLKSSLLKFQIH